VRDADAAGARHHAEGQLRDRPPSVERHPACVRRLGCFCAADVVGAGVTLASSPESPVLYLRLADTAMPAAEAHLVMRRVADYVRPGLVLGSRLTTGLQMLRKKHILVAASRVVPLERGVLAPSVRVCVSAAHSADDRASLAVAFTMRVRGLTLGGGTVRALAAGLTEAFATVLRNAATQQPPAAAPGMSGVPCTGCVSRADAAHQQPATTPSPHACRPSRPPLRHPRQASHGGARPRKSREPFFVSVCRGGL
jgi:hypothetical protein